MIRAKSQKSIESNTYEINVIKSTCKSDKECQIVRKFVTLSPRQPLTPPTPHPVIPSSRHPLTPPTPHPSPANRIKIAYIMIANNVPSKTYIMYASNVPSKTYIMYASNVPSMTVYARTMPTSYRYARTMPTCDGVNVPRGTFFIFILFYFILFYFIFIFIFIFIFTFWH